MAIKNEYFHLLLIGILTVSAIKSMDYRDLAFAVERNDLEKVKQLLKASVKDESSPYHLSCLHIACSLRYVDIVKILCEDKVDVNRADEKGITPLIVATLKGNSAMVSVLCKFGADVNKIDDLGQAPLYIASWGGDEEKVKILFSYGADFKRDYQGNTPIHGAADRLRVIPYLIFFYGKQILTMQNNKRETALDCIQNVSFVHAKDQLVKLLSGESLLDQEVERVRDEQLAKGMKRNCQRLNPLAYLAGREIGKRPFQIKLDEQNIKKQKLLS